MKMFDRRTVKHNKKGIGDRGEDLACAYLVENCYKIIARNFQEKYGEVDIIGLAQDRTLVFFEVKTMNCGPRADLVPEDNASAAKLGKLRKICAMYANANPDLVRDERGWRIDLIAIALGENPPSIKHYENI